MCGAEEKKLSFQCGVDCCGGSCTSTEPATSARTSCAREEVAIAAVAKRSNLSILVALGVIVS